MAALLLSEGRSRKIYGVNERCGQSNGTGGYKGKYTLKI